MLISPMGKKLSRVKRRDSSNNEGGAIFYILFKENLSFKVTFEQSCKVRELAQGISQGTVFQAEGTASAKPLWKEHV